MLANKEEHGHAPLYLFSSHPLSVHRRGEAAPGPYDFVARWQLIGGLGENIHYCKLKVMVGAFATSVA
jgi:hypothetical protein